jgi:RNA polymerase sigma-70 factor (ECF subfamily)
VRRLGVPPDVDPTDVAGHWDLLRELRALPTRQAAALVLRHYHGYTNREIARALGVPERTIASRLIRARTRLQLRLAGDPGWRTRPAPGVSPDE